MGWKVGNVSESEDPSFGKLGSGRLPARARESGFPLIPGSGDGIGELSDEAGRWMEPRFVREVFGGGEEG